MAKEEFFPKIGKIKFEGKDSKNPMAYHYYDAEKVIMPAPNIMQFTAVRNQRVTHLTHLSVLAIYGLPICLHLKRW